MKQFSDHIQLEQMKETAVKEYQKIREKCETIQDDLKRKLNGQSRGKFIIKVLGILGCLAVSTICVLFMGNQLVCWIFLAAAALMILCEIIDFFHGINYYGKLFEYDSQISLLIKNVIKSENIIETEYQNFLNRQQSAWDCPLVEKSSIPETAESIAKKVTEMNHFSDKLLKNLRTVLFFAFSLITTFTVSFALFGMMKHLIEQMCDAIIKASPSDQFMNVALMILTVIATIVEAVIVGMIWGEEDRELTFWARILSFAGPVVFFLGTIVIAFVSIIVIFIIQLLLQLLLALLEFLIQAVIIIIIIAVAISCLSGG